MKRIRLLIVEDNSIDKRLIEEYLSNMEDIHFEFTHAFRLKEAFNLLNLQEFDVVTLDLGLPDSHGFETFEKFQASFPHVPTIVVSGHEDPEIAKKVIATGGHGFIVKGNFDQGSLLKEIKLAINKEDFRKTVANKLAKNQAGGISRLPNLDRKEGATADASIALSHNKLTEREPEIFQEFVSEYMHLVPISSEIDINTIRTNVAEFFEKNREACAMLNLTQEDMHDIHIAAIGKLNFIDKNNPNFKSLAAILLHEVDLVFSIVSTKVSQ